MKNLLFALLLLPAMMQAQSKSAFVQVKDQSFLLNGSSYTFLGTNFWYGHHLGAYDTARLIRELDRLSAMGVKNLRILGSSEGPDEEPWRMSPALQSKPGVYNEALLKGMDKLLVEMRKRNMKAVVVLNNFWPWSGGMAQYRVWVNNTLRIPYPPPQPYGDWHRYQVFTALFYKEPEVITLFHNHVKFMIERVNSLSKIAYKNDPTIMSWQLCNEPRGMRQLDAFRDWIHYTAQLIKSIDKNHLVCAGVEGETNDAAYAGMDVIKDASSPFIDYTTAHLWVQNWNVYDPNRHELTYRNTVKYMQDYVRKHVALANKLNKPLVLEEFGIGRDKGSMDIATAVKVRDNYYGKVFEEVIQLIQSNTALRGVNFWAWGGEGRPAKAGGYWKKGDDYIGDPPHEQQGWYSVYDTDKTTIQLISEYAVKINSRN